MTDTPPPEDPEGSTPADAAADPGEPDRDPFAGPDWEQQQRVHGQHRPGAVRVRVKRTRVNRRTQRRKRRLGLGMLLLGAVIVIGGIWIAVTGLMARSQLQTARADVSRLRSEVSAGDFTAARATARDMRAHAHRADQLTTGPAWATAAWLPGGGPFGTVRTLTQQIDYLAGTVLPPLIDATAGIDPHHLKKADGSYDLAPLGRAAPALDTAVTRLTGSADAVAQRPAHSWAGPVDSARRTLLDQLTKLETTLRPAALAAHVAPALLGQNGVQRYFVAFENEAEMRGTGGLPGAFAIVEADHGKVSFERFESDDYLEGVRVNVPLGREFTATYGDGPQIDYRNTNLSPHFPYAAQLWMAMWQKKTGQKLTGAATLDPTALSYLLKVTGPARMKDGTTVSASDVVALTQQTVYSRFAGTGQNAQRKAFLLDLAGVASARILHSGASTADLIRAGAHAVRERRLLLYTSDSAVESQLAGTNLAGEVPPSTDPRPYAGLSVVNLGGNKLDYYLSRSLTWQTSTCQDSDALTRDVTVTITVHNGAPAGLPRYVTERSDVGRPADLKPGDQRLLLSYFATTGAGLRSAYLDGAAASFYPQTERGRPVWAFDVELPRGATRTLVLHLTEPTGDGPLDVYRQPGVRQLAVTERDPHC